MLTDITSFTRYFDGVHRRTLRDIGALPEHANGWSPASSGDDEAAWGVNQLIAHIVAARQMFASAYRAEGWFSEPDVDTSDWSTWPALIERSGAVLQAVLRDTPDDWLARRVPAMEGDETIAGWRILMMLTEHEIHHRSQLDTYAGLNGWEPPQIYGRRWEDVMEIQDQAREAR